MENEEWTKRKSIIKLFNFTIFIQGQITSFLHKQVEWFTGFFQIDEAKNCLFFFFRLCVISFGGQ